MIDEIYDVVDENGNRISTATWTEVHTKGLLHQVIAAFIFKDTKHSEILLQKRNLTMAQDPGKWAHSCGGHILAGNSPEKSILMELQEELFEDKLLPNDIAPKLVARFVQNDLPNNSELFYLYEIIFPGPFVFGKKEVAEVKWVSWEWLLKDAEENPNSYTQSFQNSLKKYCLINPFYKLST